MKAHFYQYVQGRLDGVTSQPLKPALWSRREGRGGGTVPHAVGKRLADKKWLHGSCSLASLLGAFTDFLSVHVWCLVFGLARVRSVPAGKP